MNIDGFEYVTSLCRSLLPNCDAPRMAWPGIFKSPISPSARRGLFGCKSPNVLVNSRLTMACRNVYFYIYKKIYTRDLNVPNEIRERSPTLLYYTIPFVLYCGGVKVIVVEMYNRRHFAGYIKLALGFAAV